MKPFAGRSLIATAVLVAGSCQPANDGSSSLCLDTRCEVSLLLGGNKDKAPLYARFPANSRSDTCRVPHWATLHPEDGTKVWGEYNEVAVSEVIRSHALVGDPAVTRFFGPASELADALEPPADSAPRPALVLVAPWAGTTELECNGQSMGGAWVIWRTIATGDSYGDVSTDEIFNMAAQNVEAEGLGSITDEELAVENGCPDAPNDCIQPEPPEP